MKPAEILNFIGNYKQRGENWFKMAGLIEEVSRSGGWVGVYNSNADWLKAAAEKSGYQPTVVRRMLRVRTFLERMQQDGLVLPQENDLPLASLEILERMFAVAPERCQELLRRAVKGEITLREVQKEYSVATSQPTESPNKSDSVTFFKYATQAVADSIHLFSEDKSVHLIPEVRRNKKFFISDAIAITKLSISDTYAVGFEFKYISDVHAMRANRNNVLQRLAFISQFFDRFWIVFSEGLGTEYAKWMIEAMRELELYNVGVIVLRNNPVVGEDCWEFLGSVMDPTIESPDNAGFFPALGEYRPRWKHLLIKRLCEICSPELD